MLFLFLNFYYYYNGDYDIVEPPVTEGGSRMVALITSFFDAATAAATSAISVVIAGMTSIAEAALENPIIAVAFGVGLMFTGIRFIPRLISALRG